MKNILLVVAMAGSFAAAPVVAEEQHVCESVGDLAGTIMEGRQLGGTLSQMLALSDNSLAQEMVLSAFKEPRYSSEKYRRESVVDFRNIWELACYEAME